VCHASEYFVQVRLSGIRAGGVALSGESRDSSRRLIGTSKLVPFPVRACGEPRLRIEIPKAARHLRFRNLRDGISSYVARRNRTVGK